MPITRTAMVDDDGTGTTGTIINNAWKTELYNQIDALVVPAQSQWTAYTPTWANTGGAVAIGNGTLAGRYVVNGKTVHFVLGMVAGSTTTFGPAGIYSWGLPLAPLAIAGLSTLQFNVGLLSQAGSGQVPIATYSLTATSFFCITAAAAVVGPTVPFTWVSGCSIAVRGTFDIA